MLNDIRYKYKNKNNINDPIKSLPLSEDKKNLIRKSFDTIFDYLNHKDYGLKRFEYSYELTTNKYESLYNQIIFYSKKYTRKKLNIDLKFNDIMNSYNEYIEQTSNNDIKSYFSILMNQTNILFNDFNYYNPKCIIYYKYNHAPNVQSIIKYLDNNGEIFDQMEKYTNDYFNNFTHKLFITPYYLISNYLDYDSSTKDNIYIKNILNILNYQIKNIWYDDINSNDFKLRDINPKEYLYNINNLLLLFKMKEIKNIYSYKYKLLSNNN